MPFSSGDWAINKNNPEHPEQPIGRRHKGGPNSMVPLASPGRRMSAHPPACLEP